MSGYTPKNLQVTLCRAAGDGIAIAFDGLGTDLFQNNTFVGYGATSYDILCTGGWQTCSGANTVFENNVNLAISNTTYNSGVLPGLFVFQEDSQWSTIDHNLYYNFKAGCPTLTPPALCGNPLLVNEPPLVISSETTLDNFNFNITGASPAKFTGLHIAGLTIDNAGNAYANPPSMGGLEYVGAPSIVTTTFGTGSFFGTGKLQ